MGVLDNINIFADLSQEEKSNLELFCQQKFAQAGEEIFHEGDEGNAMYILAEGSIEISNMLNGKKRVLGTVHAEEIVGEMALFGEKTTRMATAIAKQDSVLVTILSFSIKDLTANHPDLLEKIKNIIEERKINNKILEKKFNHNC